MPVDYKLRTLRRLFGVRSMFQKPKSARRDPRTAATGSLKDEGDADEEAVVQERPRERGRTNMKKTIWGTGGVPRAFFDEEPPRMVSGKPVGRVLWAIHLYEKQKMRLYYGAIRDGKFRDYVLKAKRSKYNTDAELMRLLEMRFDSVLYRTGFVQTPAQARQWIAHGKILVNGYRLDKRNAPLSPGDTITFQDNFMEKALEAALAAAETRKQLGCGASWIPSQPTPVGMIPWLEVDRQGLSAALVRRPYDYEVRALRNAALYPYIRDANLNPYAAMRAYR
eukprot:Plantae.Rhodophyta-Hildenbrandia_rubra.ctg3471.p1 GENE.Plantae.Rhodophyta-Hildenbrandia_rubra.ctg3471~~Plantae.Rhodophyta-Hildenbrandia_rubra.ctg3471.p1  ORF type:complete len:280 (-),score=57.67 Plantae.Rhodophyta-Hildenbrandia_rubra.ctg3471:2412-3251(-)